MSDSESSSSSSEEVKKSVKKGGKEQADLSKKRKRDDAQSNAIVHREAQLTWEVPSFGSKSKSDKDASSSLCPPLIGTHHGPLSFHQTYFYTSVVLSRIL
jgi:hypothetical protein